MRRILSLAAVLLLFATRSFAQSPSESTGTISAAGADCSTVTRCVTLSLGSANGTGLITVGTFTGTIAVEVSGDNTTWTSPSGGTASITTTGTYTVSLQGARFLRVRSSTLSSGTPAIVLSATSAPFYGSVAVTGTATVSGSVTANAGTNLNTSTLALETGGNLAAIKADVDKIPSQGQALAAASLPVVLTAAQITTLTPLSTVTANLGTLNGAATAAGVAALEVTQGSPTSGQSGVLTQGAVTTAAPSYTTAQTAPLSLDTSGNLRVSMSGGGSNAAASATGSAVPASAGYTGVNVGGTLRGVTGLSTGSLFPMTVAIVDGSGTQVTAFSGSGGTSSNFGSAIPSSGTAAGASDGTNMQLPRVFDGDSGAGTQYVLGTNLRKIASGGTVEAGTSSDPLRVDPTGTTTQPVNVASINAVTPLMGNGVTGTGSQRVTIASDNTAFGVNASGTKTNNNAAPGATNVGALGFLANAAKPSWTEGNLVAGSVDLNGAIRATFLDSGGTTTTDTTAHAVKTLSVDSTGAAIVPTTLATQDTALTVASTTGGVLFGRASAAAPTAVGADDRSVMGWFDRRGALFTNPAFAGVLASTGTGAVGTGTQRIAIGTDTATIAGSAPGTAGTASSNVVTVQGIASMTALTVSQATGTNLHVVCDGGTCGGSGGFADNAAFTFGTSVISPIGGVLDDTSTNAATENSAAIARITPQKALHVSLRTQAGVEEGVAATPLQVSLANTGANTNKLLVTPDSVALPANQSVNESQINGVTPLMGNGTTGTGSQRVTIASDNTAFSVNATATGAAASGASKSGNPVQIGGVFNTTQPTVTNGQAVEAQATARGAQIVAPGVDSFAVQATLQTQTDTVMVGGVNVKEINGVAPTMGNGASGTGVQRVTIASDSTGQVAITGTVTVASHAVTNAGTFAVQATQAPTAASGDALTECVVLSTASTNSTNCKASAGNLFSYELFNTTTTVYYLRLYNSATTPTCSSATGFIRSIPIPPAAAAGGVGGAVSNGTFGVAYSTGIAYCLTGGSTSTDNTNAAAGVFGSIKVK